MLWCDQLADKASGPQTVNDSKTPSGRVHVGALRGVLIHDAIYRTLLQRGIEARYLFGVDDYDPVDEIPAGEREHFEKFLGAPLCNVPAPRGSSAPDMAEHYIGEFFEIFQELGVRVEKYRMRDVYRSGRFNEAIDLILKKSGEVRRIYKEVSNSVRPDSWHPFQVICENCGRIGTTEVSGYDGGEVEYTCRPDLVKWARGCGHRGKVSPFDGRGKLPWKLEWVAKWRVFPVTIEGAGKDHSTKGGSRDVAAACMREIFGGKPPLNVPYEFFLVGGAKMSSSRGIGASARDISHLLPPEILRFLMLRTKPNSIVNFTPDEEHITKLFNEFDRCHWKVFHDPNATDDEKKIHALCRPQSAREDYYAANFQLVVTLVQMPHLDVWNEIEKRKGSPLTELDRADLRARIEAAKFWVENYAREEEKTRLQQSLPARAADLTASQRAFLRLLAAGLPGTEWKDDALQSKVFEVARLTPVDQPAAFQAIYCVLLDRASGPKAGNLMAVLEPEFVIRRLNEVPFDQDQFWRESAISEKEAADWLTGPKMQIVSLALRLETSAARPAFGALEIRATLADGKTHLRRIIVEPAGEEEFQTAGARLRGITPGLPWV